MRSVRNPEIRCSETINAWLYDISGETYRSVRGSSQFCDNDAGLGGGDKRKARKTLSRDGGNRTAASEISQSHESRGSRTSYLPLVGIRNTRWRDARTIFLSAPIL